MPPASSKADFQRRGLMLLGLVGLFLLASIPTWAALLRTALRQEHSSHILLVPAVVLALLLLDREKIFSNAGRSWGAGALLILVGGVLYVAALLGAMAMPPSDRLSLEVFGVVTACIGALLLCYGSGVLRAGLFPFLFLYFLVPLPSFLLDGVTSWLLIGSAEVTDLLFTLTGVPVFRKDSTFYLSSVTIEVARECSGIRSSIALFITSLLAGYFLLKSPWRRACFVAAMFPILVIKNGVRIVTLTLLSVYVDPGFLTGKLHKSGGVFFFLLGLILAYPVLHFLEKSEKKARGKTASPRSPVSAAPTSA